MAKAKEADSNKIGGQTAGKNKTLLKPEDGIATQFTSERQPSPESKSAGHKKKRLLRDLADVLVTGKGLENGRKIADSVGVDLIDEDFTLEVMMTLRQIEKALLKGDTQAYNAAMDRLRGKAQQSIDVTTGGVSVQTFLDQFKDVE
jgi:hypothetical protein